MAWKHPARSSNTIIKFPDDTTVVGFISGAGDTETVGVVSTKQPYTEHLKDQTTHTRL